MTRRKLVEILLDQYGSPAEIHTADKVQNVRAVIQPLGYRNREYPELVFRPEGVYDSSHFLYIGPVSCRLDREKEAAVWTQGEEYAVRSAQIKELAGEQLYLWAILQRQAVTTL